MGNIDYPRYIQRKRKDYDIEEIEKKYSEEELTKLILLSYVQNYPSIRIIPTRMCGICKTNKAGDHFQLSGFLLCDECYKKEKEENFNEMLKVFSERKIIFEGDVIIENKLILGSIESSYMKEDLKKLGVTHILMVGFFMTPIYPDDFIYGNYEINDDTNENILQYLVDGIKFIENSNICYCHCQLGKSRSASFVIAYIMYKNKIHYSPAFDYVKKKRKMIFPNEGFQCQLEDFDIILSNFDYDLNKCDEFIKKFMKEKDELRVKEREYIMEKLRERAIKHRRKYSDTEYDSDDDDGKIEVRDKDDEEDNNNKKEELPLDENKNKENKDDINKKEELPLKEVEKDGKVEKEEKENEINDNKKDHLSLKDKENFVDDNKKEELTQEEKEKKDNDEKKVEEKNEKLN